MLNPHITPQQRRQLVRLRAEGHSKTAIAERMGLNRHTVARQLAAPAPVNAARQLTKDDLLKLRYVLDVLTEREACPGCGATMYCRSTDTPATCASCRRVWLDGGGEAGASDG